MDIQNWKQVSASNNPKWDFLIDGDLIGEYVGMETEVGPNKSKVYTFKVDDKLYTLWGCAILDRALPALKNNTMVKVVFKGKIKSPKGQMVNGYEVYVSE